MRFKRYALNLKNDLSFQLMPISFVNYLWKEFWSFYIFWNNNILFEKLFTDLTHIQDLIIYKKHKNQRKTLIIK